MPPIPINKGAFKNVEAHALRDSEYAVSFENLLLDDAGANVDFPGLGSFASIGSSPVIGMRYFTVADKVVAVTEDRKIWSINSAGTVTEITGAATLGGSSRPTFADDGTYLAIAGGGAPKRWSGTGNTEAMPGSPPNCTHIVCIDGYWITFVLDDQEMRLAGPTSVTRETWNSSDFFSAESNPDNVAAVFALRKELYVFGTKSLEIFTNVGDSVTPFKPIFAIDQGLGAPYSVAQGDNTLWWLNEDRRFVFAEGRTPKIVSTPFDKEINAFSTVSDCWAASVKNLDGYDFIMWTFPTEERTFYIDLKNREWGEAKGFANGQSQRHRIHSYAYFESQKKHLIGDYETGTVQHFSRTYKLNGSLHLKRRRLTGQITHGTGNQKRNVWYDFFVKRGVGSQNSATPLFEVRFKDDGKPWGTPYQVSLGAAGDNLDFVRIRNTGLYRERQIEITCTDNVEFNLARIEEKVKGTGR